MKQLIALMLAGVFALALTGCETVKGLGKDIEKLGSAINKKADEVEKDDSGKAGQ
jgi:entericidin B